MYILTTTVAVGVVISVLNKLSPFDYHGEVVYALDGNLEEV